MANYQFHLYLPPDCPTEVKSYLQKLYDSSLPCAAPDIPGLYGTEYCRVWMKAKSKKGYAAHKVPPKLARISKTTYVHRFIYECVNGPLDKEQTIDHICGRKECINLSHLRIMDRNLNADLGDHRKLYKGE